MHAYSMIGLMYVVYIEQSAYCANVDRSRRRRKSDLFALLMIFVTWSDHRRSDCIVTPRCFWRTTTLRVWWFRTMFGAAPGGRFAWWNTMTTVFFRRSPEDATSKASCQRQTQSFEEKYRQSRKIYGR